MKRCKHKINSFFTALGMTLLVMLVVGFGMNPALAVDDGPFQLDGNAQQSDNPNGNPDDWDTPPKPTGSATAYTDVVPDKNGLDNIFRGGGSKTPNVIEDWLWKTSPPPPDKNNITNAQMANYVVGGKQVIYFEADLFADNGDAELAFWLFQLPVAAVPDGATQGDFSGSHMDEDPYVAVKFSNGGTQANITVYEWWDACTKPPGGATPGVGDCAADNIRVRVAETSATCDGTGGKVACAITNSVNKPSPWPYTPKTGTPNIFPPTTFFEGGINIFDIFGENKCFAAFAVTTGASTSFTATAKDFVLEDFNVCSVAATKVCENDSEGDDSPGAITYNVRGCGFNDGGGSINITSLLNSVPKGATAEVPSDLEWYVPGMVDNGSGGTRDFDPTTDCGNEARLFEAIEDGVLVGNPSTHELAGGDALVYRFTEVTAMNSVMDEVTIDAEGVDGTDITAATADATCPEVLFDADLNVSKQCSADLEVNGAGDALEVIINVQGTVCNTGEVELTDLALTDGTEPALSVDVTLTPDTTTLAPAGEEGACTDYTGSYKPDTIPTGKTCPFSDAVTATATAPQNTRPTDNCVEVGEEGLFECTATSNSATCLLRATDDESTCETGPLSELP